MKGGCSLPMTRFCITFEGQTRSSLLIGPTPLMPALSVLHVAFPCSECSLRLSIKSALANRTPLSFYLPVPVVSHSYPTCRLRSSSPCVCERLGASWDSGAGQLVPSHRLLWSWFAEPPRIFPSTKRAARRADWLRLSFRRDSSSSKARWGG